MQTLLHVSDLTSSYDGQTVLHDVSFAVGSREKVALVGANGSGKSTLLLTLAGCLAPVRGAVLLQGENCTARPRQAGNYLGVLFQRQECQLLLPSVREELLLSLADMVPDPQERQHEVMNFAQDFGIAQLLDKAPHRLSSGEQQRVALGTLLIAKPSLLLLDEPTASLDPLARRTLMAFLRELDTALLMATHDLDCALCVTQRSLILDQGRLVADGASRVLLQDKDLLTSHGLDLPLCLQPWDPLR